MSKIITQFDVEAPAAAVWKALTTDDGVRGWWTSRAEVPTGIGRVVKVHVPDAPMSWDLRVDEAVEGEKLHWHCVGGPPPWIDTDILFQIGAAPEGGTRVLFDHIGWKDAEEMVRIVTFGWVQMFQRLKAYAETGAPQPYFDF